MIFRYVPHARVPDYERLGWINTDALAGCHHGEHAELLKWPDDGEPVEPPREAVGRIPQVFDPMNTMQETVP